MCIRDSEIQRTPLVLGHSIERYPSGANHLDVPLSSEDAPVAAEHNRVRGQAKLGAQSAVYAGGIERIHVESIVDDAHLVHAVREE